MPSKKSWTSIWEEIPYSRPKKRIANTILNSIKRFEGKLDLWQSTMTCFIVLRYLFEV